MKKWTMFGVVLGIELGMGWFACGAAEQEGSGKAMDEFVGKVVYEREWPAIRPFEEVVRKELQLIHTNMAGIITVSHVDELDAKLGGNGRHYKVEVLRKVEGSAFGHATYRACYAVICQTTTTVQFVENDEDAFKHIMAVTTGKVVGIERMVTLLRCFGLLRGYSLVAPEPYGEEVSVKAYSNVHQESAWKMLIGRVDDGVEVSVPFRVTRGECRIYKRYGVVFKGDGAITGKRGEELYSDPKAR